MSADPLVEFRVVWKRSGLRKKERVCKRLTTAEKTLTLLSGKEDDRLAVLGLDPDDYHCCNGYQCGCGGVTNREWYRRGLYGLQPLEYARIERRRVGAWEAL